jgi:hypothetical protein
VSSNACVSYGIEIATPALDWIECVPAGVIYRYIEQGQYRGKARFKPFVERECFLDHLAADFVLLVPILDRKVALEKCDHGQVARRSAERDRCGLKNQPAKQPMRVGELMKKTRFADAGLADDRHQLAQLRGHRLLCTAELIQFGVAADELG